MAAEPDAGKIDTLEKASEIPLRFVEAVLEGMTTAPARYAAIGLGFYLGYEGYDVLTWLMSRFRISGTKIAASVAESAPDNPVEFMVAASLGPVGFIPGAIDAATILMYPWTAPLGKLLDSTKTPQEHRDELKMKTFDGKLTSGDLLDAWTKDAGVTPLSTLSSILEVAKTMAAAIADQVEADIAAGETSPEMEKLKDSWELLRRRILMGSFGAFAALLLTSPGFLGGIGEIVKGVGEIVPG